MRMYRLALVALLLVGSAALGAAPVITSVAPASVTVDGGTQLLIRGTGFSDNCTICSPPYVQPIVTVGGTPATDVRVFGTTLITAITAPMMPGTYSVSLGQWDGSSTAPGTITVTGDPLDAFEPVVFPIFSPPVLGSFGSEFRTFANFWNADPTTPLHVFGQDGTCLLITPVLDPSSNPMILAPRGDVSAPLVQCSTWPARTFYVPKGSADDLVASLRVADVSRSATSFGTEIPVLRQDDFTTAPIALLEVPVEANFRSTLRIYSLARTDAFVNVRIGDAEPQQVHLTPGENDFEPAYAVFTDFPTSLPAGATRTRVVIDSEGYDGPPIWAFISVTNNETQHITTITPQ